MFERLQERWNVSAYLEFQEKENDAKIVKGYNWCIYK